jgi:nucleoid-associated protein YgaU
VVERGETLWGIADDLLGRGASDAQIERMVKRIWALNAGGLPTGDPDLILPGERLVLPPDTRLGP